MGVTHRLVLDGTQTKTLVGIVGCLLEPTIVEDQRLRLRIFKIKLAIVGAFEAVGEMAARVPLVKPGTLEERHCR